MFLIITYHCISNDAKSQCNDHRDNDHRDNDYRNVPNNNPRPNWNQQPTWNQQPNWNQSNVTLEGTVISDSRGNGFTLRTANGQQLVVQVQGGEPYGISRGDVVRVFGKVNGNHFNALSTRILTNR